MTMARDEYIFLIILAVNLIVSVLYLAAGIVLMVPARASLARRSCMTTEELM
jgi:type III secretory pathway component EscR